MANRVQIPISFSYASTFYVSSTSGSFTATQVSLELPAAGSTITVTNRVTQQPAIVYAGATGATTITPVVTDAGGNVPGYVPEGSYAISAAAVGSFAGATVNWEAIYGAGVGNVASNAVDTPQLSSTLQTNLSYYTPPAPVGALMHYAGSSDPIDADGVKRWMIADGRSGLSQATNPGLWNAIGSTYGGSSANFNLPDLRSRVAVGAGQGGGLTNRTLGSTGGEERHTLANAEMPNHSHGGQTGSGTSGWMDRNNVHSHTTNNAVPAINADWGVWGGHPSSGSGWTYGSGQAGQPVFTFNSGTSSPNIDHLHSVPNLSIAPDGSSSSHNNMQPYLAVNHIIRIL